ncbi:MAG TPA: integration host factor subunit beta [Thermodesulfobacteriota bacterium]|nr:integration host factor subunit beta [Thermodesulfobacteriota bacterium]
MTRSELIEEVASKAANFTKKDVEMIISTLFQSIAESLSKGGKIEIRGFGSFKVKKRNARSGRNPKSGEGIRVDAKKVPFFKAGKELKERVNTSK